MLRNVGHLDAKVGLRVFGVRSMEIVIHERVRELERHRSHRAQARWFQHSLARLLGSSAIGGRKLEQLIAKPTFLLVIPHIEKLHGRSCQDLGNNGDLINWILDRLQQSNGISVPPYCAIYIQTRAAGLGLAAQSTAHPT